MITMTTTVVGNWNPDSIPMVSGWLFLVFTFVAAVELLAHGARRALNGEEEGYVDD
jgi:hypothetical protein